MSGPPIEASQAKPLRHFPVPTFVDPEQSPVASPVLAVQVDSFGEAFRLAPWPTWTLGLLGAQVAATLIAVVVLLVSRSWSSPPPALEVLRQAQCPLYLAYTNNTLKPFTLWLPSCPNVISEEALPCRSAVDCVAAGPLCASAAVRASMTCEASAADPMTKYCHLSMRDSHYSPFCLTPTPHCAMCRTLDCTNEAVSCVATPDCSPHSAWKCYT